MQGSLQWFKSLGASVACAAALTGASALATAGAAHAQDWKPTKPVLYTIPAGPGGALDQSVRMVKNIAEKRGLIDQPIVIENKPGGAGRIAMSPLDQHPGDPHYLTVITYSLLTNNIIGHVPFGPDDVTPLAMLFGEFVTIAVAQDSPVKDAMDLVARLRKDPTSLSLGVATSLGNHIHVGAAKPLKAAGVDISKMTVVPYKSSQESLTNLLGGHLDVMASTTPNVLTQMKAGKIRVLAIASAERLGGPFADVPTWRELGVDATYNSAQGVMTSKGVPAAAVAYWQDLFRKVTDDPEWKAFVESRHWAERYRTADEARVELKQAYVETREVLTDLGLAKQ